MNRHLITEIGGRLLSPLNYNSLPVKIPQFRGLELQQRSNYTKSFNSIHDLDHWQQELYQHITNGQSVLVNVNPAGGKTKPVVYAWEDTFNNSNYDKILWVTPTVQLANQVFHVDLKESILNLLKKWSENPYDNRFPTQLLPVEIQHVIGLQQNNGSLNSKNLQLGPQEINIIHHWLENVAMALRTGTGKSGEINNNTIATVCTYDYAPNILDRQRPKFVVIDELQQYVPIEWNDNDKEASKFINVLRGIPNSSVLVLLTGSMNYDTSEQIAKFIERYFGKKLIVFPRREDTPVAKNRAHIQIIPHSKMSSAKDKINIIKNCIHNRQPGNAMIMFSVKSNTDAFLGQNGLYSIAKQLTLELPKRTPEQVCGVSRNHDNPFHPHPYDIDQNNYQQSVSLNNTAKFLSQHQESPEKQLDHLYYMLSQKQNVMGQYHGDPPEALSDPFLAECILCGFGYLAGGKLKGFRMHNDDIMLVQNLFKQGKIYFLLATDMIGVGTTLTIRNLYIPSLLKPKGHGLPMGTIDESSLVQLINRVGRQTDVAATIYCTTEDYADIHRLLNNDPSSEVSVAMFGKSGPSAIEKQVSLIDNVRMVLNMIRGCLS